MPEIPSGIRRRIDLIKQRLWHPNLGQPETTEVLNPIMSGIHNSMMIAALNRRRNIDYDQWAQKQKQFEKYLGQPENIVAAIFGRRCIDGRYSRTGQSQGMIARPGGDYGYALILASVTDPDCLFRQVYSLPVLTPQESFDMVFDAVTVGGKRFYMHTDHHDNGEKIGCGHAAAPMTNEAAYRLFEGGRPDILLAHVRERFSQETEQGTGRLYMENLHGSHNEGAVVIVTGMSRTIRSQSEAGEMYFVYDLNRDYEYMVKELLPVLSERLHLTGEGRERFFADFLYISSVQTENSLNLLARDKPRFLIDLDKRRHKMKMLPVGVRVDLRERFYGGEALSYKEAA